MTKEYTQIGLTPNRSNLNNEDVIFPLKLLWKCQILAPHTPTPLITEERVFVDAISSFKKGKKDSKLFTFNALTGEKEWEYIYKGGGGYGLYCLYDGMVITVDQAALLVVKDGKKILRDERTGGGYPIFYKGLLIFSSAGGVCFVDPLNWRLVRKLDAEKTMDVSCYEDKIVFGTWDGNLYCFDFETGDKLWEKSILKIGEYTFKTPVGLEVNQGRISGRFPHVINGKIYISLTMYVCCFDLETGELVWRTDLGSVRETVYKDGKLYGYDRNFLYCLDAETGRIIYKKGGAKRTGGASSVPFISGDTFFVGAVGIYAFDIRTGDLIWEFYSKRYYPFETQPIFINGRLYASCSDGYLYCFESKNK